MCILGVQLVCISHYIKVCRFCGKKQVNLDFLSPSRGGLILSGLSIDATVALPLNLERGIWSASRTAMQLISATSAFCTVLHSTAS